MRIVVLGYIVRGPLGGLAWHHLQYVIGLKRLGHEVLFMEDSDDFPGCYNPETFVLDKDPQFGLSFIHTLFSAFDLTGNWAYYDAHKNEWHGWKKEKVYDFCKTADVVFNLSGINPLREWWSQIHSRVFIDTDPAFTQIRHLSNEKDRCLAKQHTAFFTFGENFGKDDCTIPDDGFDWKPTRQPVVMDAWKVVPSPNKTKWTTVMQWDSYKVQQYNGTTFGMKSLSFQKFENLPHHLPNENFELALGSVTAPGDELKKKGWEIISSLAPTKTPWTYQQYIQQSKGEWSVAKHGYVASNSGWFSERSCSYLASGRPVILQDTGFSKFLETGKGLFSFSTIEETIAAIQRVNENYTQHCKGARAVAEEYFSAANVLRSLLDRM